MTNKINNDVLALLADVMIRISALERVLITKKIISEDELNQEVDKVALQFSETVLKSIKETIPTADELLQELADSETDN